MEFSAIEIIQNILLVLTIAIIFKYMKILLKKYSKIMVNLRITLLMFILYEEISYVSRYFYDKFSFNLNNMENEINLHNHQIFSHILFEDIPFFGEIGIRPIIFSLFFFFIGYGSYFSKGITKDFKFFFLEKKYSHYSNIFLLNLILSGIFRYFNLINLETDYLLHFELEEMFFYFILFVDTLHKIHINLTVE